MPSLSANRGTLTRLDVLAQSGRDKDAALRLLRKPLKNQGLVPASIVTDRYRAYDVAFCDLRLSGIHLLGKRLNNRAESSHVPIRRRERKMQGFQSAGSAQRFLSSYSAIYNTLNVCRYLTTGDLKLRYCRSRRCVRRCECLAEFFTVGFVDSRRGKQVVPWHAVASRFQPIEPKRKQPLFDQVIGTVCTKRCTANLHVVRYPRFKASQRSPSALRTSTMT
jgi:hypothetical protein